MALGAASCTDSFLEEKMVSTITQDYFETEQGLEQLVVGTYGAWRVPRQYNQGPNTLLVGVDLAQPKNANWAQYSSSVWNANDRVASYANALAGEYSSNGAQPLGYYPIINNCNRAIVTLRGEAPGKYATDAEANAQLLSEALVNRCYCIYMLNTMYGDVYVPTDYTQALPSSFNYPRESSESIYANMISDLRYAYEHLKDASQLSLSTDFGRVTKGTAAHFLAKLYLQRAQGAGYGTTEYGRQSDGSIDNSNAKSYLGMLYKGNKSSDLDSCVYYASQVINSGSYELEADYRQLFSHPLGDYSNESSKELIQSAIHGPSPADNGRYNNRMPAFIGGNYRSASWGIPDYVWEYPGGGKDGAAYGNDCFFDLFDKVADSRYEKSFHVEYKTALRGGSKSTPTANVDYYAYDDESNQTYTWTKEMADYFNANILPNYTRESWGGRQAVEGEHKMGTNDLAFAFVENTRENALDIEQALAMPFVVKARWIKDGNKYYYRVPTKSDGSSYTYNASSYTGLDKMSADCTPSSLKYDDPNRNTVDAYNSYRDIPVFRLAETYLLRAWAYGLKGQYTEAIADINQIRRRAAYKSGETRAEVLAILEPGHEQLTTGEQQWPYTVENDMSTAMEVDASYWDGSSEASQAEQYPESATTEEDRFSNFMLNEFARELSFEMVYYETLHHSGWQAERILAHEQAGSTLQGKWGVSDNLISGLGQTGNGLGYFQPGYTLKPFMQNFLDMLTDENGQALDDAAKKAYQNYGY